MKRIVASLLATVMVFASLAELRDLSKIALLINHYHQAHEEISLSDFLELHYGASATAHDKEHGHKSLPFKSHERTLTQPLAVVGAFFFIPQPTTPEYRKPVSLYRSVFTSEFAQSIWQPPRLA